MKPPVWAQIFTGLLVVTALLAVLMLRAVNLSIGAVVIFSIILLAVMGTTFIVAFGLATFTSTPGFQDRSRVSAVQKQDDIKGEITGLRQELAKVTDYTMWLEAEVAHLHEVNQIRQSQVQRQQPTSTATGAFPRHYENRDGGGGSNHSYYPQHGFQPRGRQGRTGAHQPVQQPIDYAPLNNGTHPVVNTGYTYDYYPQRQEEETQTSEVRRVPPRPDSLPPRQSIRQTGTLYRQPQQPARPAYNGNGNGQHRL